jgi:EAL domain-containing protein (putative c-di-GMP-specific phosphodiesterase class I)
MYRIKASGKSGYDFFDSDLRAELVRNVALRSALEQALRDDTLDLRYQPIVETRSGRTLAVEALCRWRDERFGEVPPNQFVPLAELHGLIVPLGRAVLDQAIGQLAAWRAADPQALPNGIYVNVSANELREADYCLYVTGLRFRHGLQPADLGIELTERVMIDDNDAASSTTLQALADAGVRLVLDDFGTGYSALASLKRFPLAAVKLDQLFTAEIGPGSTEAPITRAVVALGHALDILVIAEGVETAAQLAFLRSLGCEAAQGYLLGEPRPAGEVEVRFAAGRRDAGVPVGA